jgi:hypothetical protein
MTRLLFVDLALPLAADRVVAVEPGVLLHADVIELAGAPLGAGPCAFVPLGADPACAAAAFPLWESRGARHTRAAVMVADVQRFRAFALGEWTRDIFQNTALFWSVEIHEDAVATLMADQANAAVLPVEWGWCNICPNGRIARAKAVTACENARTLRRDFAFMRRNVSLWRELEIEIAPHTK